MKIIYKHFKTEHFLHFLQRVLPLAGLLAMAGTAEAQCIDSSKITIGPCTMEYFPVCGCNEVTYSNSCAAMRSGVTSTTPGACPSEVLNSFYLTEGSIKVETGDTCGLIAEDSVQLQSGHSLFPNWNVFSLESSNPEIATVSPEGMISGISAGLAAITVRLNSTGETRIFNLEVDTLITYTTIIGGPELPIGTPPFTVGKTLAASGYSVFISAQFLYRKCSTPSILTAITGNEIAIVYDQTPVPNCIPSGTIISLYSSGTDSKSFDLAAGEYHFSDSTYDTILTLKGSLQELMSSLYLSSVPKLGETSYLKSDMFSDVVWSDFQLSSSDTNVVTVNSTGVVKAIGFGNATVTMLEPKSGSSVSFTISVKPSTDRFLAFYFAQNLILTGDTTQILIDSLVGYQWSNYTIVSSNPEIAAVISDGKIDGIGEGSATITITYLATGESVSLPLTVMRPDDLPTMHVFSIDKTDMYVGDTARIEWCLRCKPLVDWTQYSVTSSNPEIANLIGDGQIQESVLLVKAHSLGTATITLTEISTGLFMTFNLTVLESDQEGLEVFYIDTTSLAIGDTARIAWNARCRCAIDWSKYTVTSSHPEIANVFGDGRIAAEALGEATITLKSIGTDETRIFNINVSTITFIDSLSGNPITPIGTPPYYVNKILTASGSAVQVFATLRYNHCFESSISQNVSGNDVAVQYHSTRDSNCILDGVIPDVYSELCSSKLFNLENGIYHFSDNVYDISVTVEGTLQELMYSIYLSSVLKLGETCYLKSDLFSDVVWSDFQLSSSDTNVVTIQSRGGVKAVGFGFATITLLEPKSGSSVSFTISVTSKDPNFQNFVLDTNQITLNGTARIFNPNVASPDWGRYDFISDNASVVTIAADGTITGVGFGYTYVRIKEIQTGDDKEFWIYVSKYIFRNFTVTQLSSAQDQLCTIRIDAEVSADCCKSYSFGTVIHDNIIDVNIDSSGVKCETASTCWIAISKEISGLSLYHYLVVSPFDSICFHRDSLPHEFASVNIKDSSINIGDTTYINLTNVRSPDFYSEYNLEISDASVADTLFVQRYLGIVIVGKAAGETTLIITHRTTGISRSFPLTVLESSQEGLEVFYIDTTSLAIGDTAQIAWNARCRCAIDWTKYTVTSSHPEVANVFDGGRIVAVALGSASITLTEISTGLTKVFTLTVVHPSQLGLDIFFLEKTVLYVGDSTRINWDAKCKCEIDWTHYTLTSSNAEVANVDANGQIQALAAGVATITLAEIASNESIEFALVVQSLDTNLWMLESMHFESDTISLGDSAWIVIDDSVNILWSEFSFTFLDNVLVSASNGIVQGIKIGTSIITVTHIPTQTSRYLKLYITYDFYTGDHIEMNVGETVGLQLNPTYSELFDLKVDNNISYIAKNKTVTATAVGPGYAGLLFYYKSDGAFAEGIKILIHDTATTPTIKSIKILNNGKTLEITFNKSMELYPGIEADFLVAMNNALKADGTFAITKVLAKAGDPNTLVLIMTDAVPANGFAVQYKDNKSFAIATQVDIAADVKATVYPNPANTSVTFCANGLVTGEILTLTGQSVAASSAMENLATIDVVHLPAGQYLAKFTTATGTFTLPLSVK